ncbi:sodium-dependent bicarbonate transport family permease [Nocardioides sp. GCM10027113]|uniref:sodium-dependent bicarbonate transport family permease n=1 Tax=unclassified Nocardioides TaxID=2615069 RepID=UPI00360DA3E9
MSSIDLALANLTHPAILAFLLGILAVLVRSDLHIPTNAARLLSAYLLLAIGLKGGAALVDASPGELAGPIAATLALGAVIPIVAFLVLERWGKFSVVDAAGIAAHYGSVSAVTFAAALAFATTVGVGPAPEAFLPALLAVLEVPGILIALALAQRAREGGGSLRAAVGEVLAGSSMLLLLGGIVIGAVAGDANRALVEPVFVTPFAGVLVIFLLHLGITAGHRLREVRESGVFLLGFAILMPLAAGSLGAVIGTMAGLSVGGAAVFGAMAGSASYIAAPAAVEVSLPEANLGHALTASLGITFPFNLALGIPLYHSLASALA